MLFSPSVVTLLDLDCDISILIDSSEEEEKEGKKGEESSKHKDVKILQVFKSDIDLLDVYTSTSLEFYSNTYTSNYLDLISPPPEGSII